MSLDGYLTFNRAQKESPWGRRRYRFMIGVDSDGAIVSSLKLFSLPGRLAGKPISIAGVGALFTPVALRGRGYAAALLELCLGQARDERHDLALLISEIGAPFYAALGFHALPACEAACIASLPAPWPGEPAWLAEQRDPLDTIPGLRPFRPDDLDALVDMHAAATPDAALAIVRDRQAWDQALLKLRLAHRLRGDGDEPIWVIEGSDGPDAYAVMQITAGALRWREHGVRPGAEARLHDLFWRALSRARGLGLKRVEGWHLPSGSGGRPLYPIARRTRTNPIVMIRALSPALRPPRFEHEDECRVPELDSF